MCQHTSREHLALLRVPTLYLQSKDLPWPGLAAALCISTKEGSENMENIPFSVTPPWRKELPVSSTVYPGQGWLSGSIFTLRWLSLSHINISDFSAGKGWQTAMSLCQSGLEEQGSVGAARVQSHSIHMGCKMSTQKVVSARTRNVFEDVHCRSTSVEVVPALCHFIHPPPSHKHN